MRSILKEYIYYSRAVQSDVERKIKTSMFIFEILGTKIDGLNFYHGNCIIKNETPTGFLYYYMPLGGRCSGGFTLWLANFALSGLFWKYRDYFFLTEDTEKDAGCGFFGTF